jgi:hypothetical protein
MISHRLADDYVMVDLFSFGYDLLQSICFVCKSFLLMSFMNENKVFSFRENFTYPPKVSRFLQIPPNVQKLSLRCIKLCFSLTLPLPYRNFFAIPILPLTPTLHCS